MFLPSFRHLIEIEALKKENLLNLKKISSENKRISDLEERRVQTALQIEKLESANSELNLAETLEKLAASEARLKKLNAQLALAVTEKEQIAFENQIKMVKDESEKLESKYFADLETSETLQEEIKTNATFLEGSANTLEEIKSEVEKNNADERNIIENRNLRINSLLEHVALALRSLYLELEIKYKNKNAVSFLIDKKCSECHMQVDSQLKTSLEEGRSIETCPSCGRLLIPETAKIY